MADLSREDAERIVRIEESSRRLEAKIDAVLLRQGEDRTDFQMRIRALERWRYGTGAALLAGITYWAQPVLDALP